VFITASLRATTRNQQQEELRQCFKLFDKDGDGYIGECELRSMMCSLGHKLGDGDIRKMVRQAGGDGDGRLSFKGFVRVRGACSRDDITEFQVPSACVYTTAAAHQAEWRNHAKQMSIRRVPLYSGHILIAMVVHACR
jgi:EF-hand domain pair